MNKKYIVNYFKERFPKEKFGNDWRFILEDCERGELVLLPGKGGGATSPRLTAVPSMRTRWFSEIVSRIFQEDVLHDFVTGNQYRFSPEDKAINESHIDDLIKDSRAWFNKVTTPQYLSEYLQFSYDNYPNKLYGQEKHIVACILKGDVEKLKLYLDSFKQGNRLEFVPIIKQEHFERAIPISQKYQSGELISPVQF